MTICDTVIFPWKSGQENRTHVEYWERTIFIELKLKLISLIFFSIIIFVSGASDAIKNVLKLLICEVDGKKPGVMVPIPQYPLYSASLAEFNMQQIGYYLDESKNWGLSISELEVCDQ